MSNPEPRAWQSRTAQETEALARQFSAALPDLSRWPAVVYLLGELGAGKTTWARGLLAARGQGRVRSPTYPILEVYALPGLTVVHLDLYRVAGAVEIEALGARELHAPGHLWLIEWPQRGAGALPAADLEVSFELHPAGRRIVAEGRTALGLRWLAAVADTPSQAD
ncbi:MAG: tRNA (adenosine(37)-N6)-threonylcarbamoyltransferase complex ATPase subunit type 1 TsaE [Steroidobacteraceae bacterium]